MSRVGCLRWVGIYLSCGVPELEAHVHSQAGDTKHGQWIRIFRHHVVAISCCLLLSTIKSCRIHQDLVIRAYPLTHRRLTQFKTVTTPSRILWHLYSSNERNRLGT